MLTNLCQELKNWFIHDESAIHTGKFTISGGKLQEVDFLLPKQYYRIYGSILNDGVYQNGVDELEDESFIGAIWSMAVPKEVIQLSKDIDDWVANYGAKAASPFMSESWGGYSYSKGSASGSSGDDGGTSWQSAFASRLNRWRKV